MVFEVKGEQRRALLAAGSRGRNAHSYRRAYGYHSPDALITMATLTRGDCCPALPGRS